MTITAPRSRHAFFAHRREAFRVASCLVALAVLPTIACAQASLPAPDVSALRSLVVEKGPWWMWSTGFDPGDPAAQWLKLPTTFEAGSGRLRMKLVSPSWGPIDSDVDFTHDGLTWTHPHLGPVVMAYEASDLARPFKGVVKAYGYTFWLVNKP